MPISLPDSRSLSDDVLEALRLRAIWGCELGFRQQDLAELLGVRAETISRWWSAYCAEGPDGLPGDRTGRPTGSGRTLSAEQETQLQELIDQNTPEDLGIAAPLWKRKAVQQLIRQETQIGEFFWRLDALEGDVGLRNRLIVPTGLILSLVSRLREAGFRVAMKDHRVYDRYLKWDDETLADAMLDDEVVFRVPSADIRWGRSRSPAWTERLRRWPRSWGSTRKRER